MAAIIRNMIRGIRSPIPSGYVVGRTDPGSGDAHLIPLQALGQAVTSAGGSAPSGVQSVGAGTNVTITGTAANPIINASGGGPTAMTFSGATVNIQGNSSLPAYISQSIPFVSGTRVKMAATVRRRSGHSTGFGLMNSSGQGPLVFIGAGGANQSVLFSRENTGGSTNYATTGAQNPNQGWVTYQLIVTADSANGATLWAAQEGGPYFNLVQDSTYDFTAGTWYGAIYDVAGITSADINSASFVMGSLP